MLDSGLSRRNPVLRYPTREYQPDRASRTRQDRRLLSRAQTPRRRRPNGAVLTNTSPYQRSGRCRSLRRSPPGCRYHANPGSGPAGGSRDNASASGPSRRRAEAEPRDPLRRGSSGCPYCQAARERLAAEGERVEERDATQNAEWRPSSWATRMTGESSRRSSAAMERTFKSASRLDVADGFIERTVAR